MLEEFKAYDKILNPVVIADESGKIIYINKGVEKLFGYRAYEILSSNIAFIMLDEDALQHGDYILRYLRTGERNILGQNREVFAKKKDGSPVHINIFLNELTANDNRYFIAEITDLSRQREAEQRLEQVTEDWHSVFNSLPQPAAISTTEGVMITVNEAFVTKTGYTREELIGNKITDIPIWVGNNRDIMAKELFTNGHVNKEFLFNTKSGPIYGLYSAKVMDFNNQKCILASISDITASKEAEKATRKANENFQMIFDHTPEVLIIHNKNWKILFTNKAFTGLTGYSEDEVIGKSAGELGLWADLEQRNEMLEEFSQKGEVINKDYRFRTKSGNILDTVFTAQSIELNGETCYLAMVYDNTGRKQAQEELKRSKENLENILDLNPNTTIITKLSSGEFIYVNQSFVDIIGYSREEAIGKTVLDLGIWVDLDERGRLFEEIQKNGFVRDKEYRFRTKSGNILTSSYAAQVIDLNGEKCLIAVGADISERKAAEEALKQSNERFQQFFYLNPDPCLMTSLTGDITYVNTAFIKISGYSEEELKNNNTLKLNIWLNHEERDIIMQKIQKTGYVLNKPMQFRIKSGKILDTLYSGQIIDVDGEKQLLSIVRDITEQKQNETALIQSNEKFQNFFNNNPEPCSITNMQGDFMYVNKAFIRDSGYTWDEIAKVNARNDLWVDPKARDTFIQELMQIGYVLKKEVQFRLKGVVRDFLYSVQLIENNGEKQLLSMFNEITEIKKKETALAKSNERFKEFFNLNPEPSVITDAQTGQYVHVNEAFAKVSGYPQEFLIGKTVADIDGWVDTRERDELMAELQKNGIALNKLVHLRRKGGDILDTSISAQLFDIEGKKQILFITRNITEQRKSEEALAKSNEKFQAFFNLNPEACLITNIKNGGTIVEANDAFLQDTGGYSRDEVIGKTTKEINLWANEDDFTSIINELKKKGIVTNKEVRFRSKSGSIEYTLYSGQVIDIDGEKHIVSIVRNINDRKIAEERIAKSNERFQKFFFFNPEPCSITTIDGKYVYANNALLNMSGYDESFIGKTTTDLNIWVDESEKEYLFKELEKNGYILNKEFKFRIKSGEIKDILYSGQIIDIDGKNHLLSMMIDITEKKKLEQELFKEKQAAEEANKAKSEFLANMSHEIRTPLNAIIGTADLLAETKLNKEQKHYIDIFQRSGEQLLSLISDILDLSKIESGHMELEHASFCMCEVVSKACDMIALRAHSKGLELIYDIDPDVPEHFIGDRTRLAQVIINLAGNALKFTEKGEISISVTKLGSSKNKTELLFSIKDSGIGIPADKLEHIFDSFAQVDSSTTRKYGGTGLGLAISKRISEMMGGRIWVESDIGKGSTFHFTAILETDNSTAVNKLNLNGSRVGIIEDHKHISNILKKHISSWGGEVSVFHDMPALRENNERFDIVLADFETCNGKENCELLKKNASSSENILMLLNSHTIQDTLGTLKNTGIEKYIIKPVKKNDLRENLRKLTEQGKSGNTKNLQKTATPAANDTTPRSILLVDDSDDNRLLIELYLKKTNYKIDTATNGQEAVAKTKENKYDLILMDVQMPVLDGYEATMTIRKWEKKNKHKAVPIIALTANAFKEDEKKSIEAGCTGHLVKPIRKDVLIEALEGIFKQS